MCNGKRKIENFELFIILNFSSHLALPPPPPPPKTEANGDTQDERRLSAGSEVIQNNARQREVMQQDLYKTPLCYVAPCHCLFNPVVSLLQLSSTGYLPSCHCPLSPVSPCLVPPQFVSTLCSFCKLGGIIFHTAPPVASRSITSFGLSLCFVTSYSFCS